MHSVAPNPVNFPRICHFIFDAPTRCSASFTTSVMPSQLTSRLGLAMAMLPAFFGVRALFWPRAALLAFGFPLPDGAQDRSLTLALMRVYGIRNIAVSHLLALLWSTGNDALKGLGLLAGIAMCFTDGLMSIQVPPAQCSRSHAMDPKVAIIGMSCRLPGNVSNETKFWEMLVGGGCGWSEIPDAICTKDAFYHPHPQKKGCFNATGGYFLHRDHAKFDAAFFNVTEQEARALDPQQRLLLECAYEALENAGIPKESVAGRKVGVFVGGAASDYHLGVTRDLDNIPMFEATGYHQSIQSGRISHYFDLRGPCITVDTACSSGLSALHQAVQSIRAGESEMCIVAACHLHLQPDDWISMSMSGLLSDHSKTYSFDHRAQSGYARGEGAACVILKPLAQAMTDNDAVRSVIVSSGINQDGRTVGLATPSTEAQELLIRNVYEKAGLNPLDVGFVEAHGTATKVGDPLEAAAVYNALGRDRSDPNPLYIGSVKSNIGHLENVSGLAAVIKATLALEHNAIPPNINFELANKSIPLQEWNMEVPTTLKPWPHNKRYVSVNNLGFGGSNAHCVLEPFSAPSTEASGCTRRSSPYKLFPLSGQDKQAATARRTALLRVVKDNPELFASNFADDMAYTLCQRRSPMAWRLAIAASSSEEMLAGLESSAEPTLKSSTAPKLVFIFTGQGAQWSGMGRQLLESYPQYKSVVLAASDCLKNFGADFSLIEELEREDENSLINLPHISQPACTAVQIALVALLSSWNIEPVAVLGHSSGEIAAAYAAGALSLQDAMAVSYYRGEAIRQFQKSYPDVRGGMLAVGQSASTVRQIIKSINLDESLVVACENSPNSTTMSGDENSIDQLSEELCKRNIFCRKLQVNTAYHSHHMRQVVPTYAAALQNIQPRASRTGVFYSSLYGRMMDNGSVVSASYWTSNLTEPVLFSHALSAVCTDIKPTALVELGPHSTLRGPIKQTLTSLAEGPLEAMYSPTLIRHKDAGKTVVELAAALFALGQCLNFEAINGQGSTERVPNVVTSLEPYQWSGEKYWCESRLSQERRLKPFGRNDLLGVRTEFSSDSDHIWRNIINTDNLPWLREHKMQSLTTFPMAGYISMATEAAYQRWTMRGVSFNYYSMREVHVTQPLLIDDDVDYEIVLTLRPFGAGTRSFSETWDEFRISSWTQGRGWLQHCHGTVGVRGAEDSILARDAKERHQNTLRARANSLCDTTVPLQSFYEQLGASGADYGNLFQMRNTEAFARSKHCCKGRIHVPDTSSQMPIGYETDMILHPAFLDQFFQLPFAILGAGSEGMASLFMPVSVKKIEIRRNAAALSNRSVDGVAECQNRSGRFSPADFNVEGWDANCTADGPLIEMTAVRMLAVANSKGEDPRPRRLCYQLEWHPLEIDACFASASSNGDVNDPAVNGNLAMPQKNFPTRPIVIIYHQNDNDPLLSSIMTLLYANTGRLPSICSTDNLEVADATCIALCDITDPADNFMSANMLPRVKKLLLEPSLLLWVSTGMYKKATSPSKNMIQGLFRTVRSEYGKSVATLDLDPNSRQSPDSKAGLIFEALMASLASEQQDNLKEFEFAEEDGKLVVPRMVSAPEMDKYLQNRTDKLAGPYLQEYEQKPRRLQLDVRIDGALDSLYFRDEIPQSIPDDEIEIEVAATGVNFKDVVVAMRHLSSPYIGIECSGTVSRTGAAISAFKKGDRVCCMSMGGYGTFTRSKETSAALIPNDMTMEVAASLPLAFCTAYYGLVTLGNLQRGERVLIHAGAGGVGQAAIQLALMIGAEIYTTVGSPAKKQLLISQYGIQEERIFSSRCSGFGSAIQDATKGEGVSVALNSLTGDLLRETWSCIAEFGRFIEIGKRDITWNTRLDMDQFDKNVTFSSVDLTLLGAKRPGTMRTVLNTVMDLISQGKIVPVTPVTVKGVSQIEEALRMLQGGGNIGKLVICPRRGECVQATHSLETRKLLRKDAAYIIAGGTGGIGRAIARWMANAGAGHVVLLSRSGLHTSGVQDLVAECLGLGTLLHVETCDIADEQSVSTVIHRCASDLAPIAGVIQAAMALRDMLFDEMSFEDFDDVVRAKVSGTWNLHNALSNTRLDFFTMLSSLTGVVGNRGQAAYAAANTFLDAFAQHRNQLGMPAVSIALTPVLDVGYLAGNSDRQAQVLRNIGDITLQENEVLALLEASIDGRMAEQCGSQCAIGLDFNASSSLPYYANDAKFARLRTDLDATSDNVAGDPEKLGSARSLEQQIRQATVSSDVLTIVTEALKRKLGGILMLRCDEVDTSKSVTSHGLDSLNAIELRNWIRKELHVLLQVLELLSSGSLMNLAASILRKTKISHCYRD
ncbi:hypothetical protein PWT90_09456 [Aphanocladium album]|nr:hypothetical protein PWT90_09456 [Aphanocladium album]